jgi:hypothetical protein
LLPFGISMPIRQGHSLLSYYISSDVSRTLWAPCVLGKVAPVPAIFML